MLGILGFSWPIFIVVLLRIYWLIFKNEKRNAKDVNISFLASPADGVTISFRVDKTLVDEIKTEIEGKASVRRFYYTALVKLHAEKFFLSAINQDQSK